VSTKEEVLSKAKNCAMDWYQELRGKKTRSELISGSTFAYAADRFSKEYELMTAGERNQVDVSGHNGR